MANRGRKSGKKSSARKPRKDKGKSRKRKQAAKALWEPGVGALWLYHHGESARRSELEGRKRSSSKKGRKPSGKKRAKTAAEKKHRGRKPRKVKRKVHPNAIAALKRWNAKRAGKKLFAGMSPAERAKYRHARKHGRKRRGPHGGHMPPMPQGQIGGGYTPHQMSFLAQMRAKAAAKKAAAAGDSNMMAL